MRVAGGSGMKRLLAVLVLLSVSTSTALAQPAEPRTSTTAQDLRALHDFARCVVLGRSDRVRELLVLDPTDPATADQFSRLMQQANQCTRGRLRGGALMFRGAAAEILLSRDLAGRSLADATRFDPALPPLQAYDFGDYMAMCLIRTRPAEVADLLATDAGSVAEQQAIDILQPHLAGCLPQGQSATANRHGLRAALATAGYRLFHHNAVAATASLERR